jgi:hypothetical protein
MNSLPQGFLAIQSCPGKEDDIRANLAYGIIKARMPICVNRKIGIVDQSGWESAPMGFPRA